MCPSAENGAGFQRVTLLGLGVMGASLGMALKKLPSPPRVTGYSRSASTRETAAALTVADRICSDPADAVADADLVVGCLPVLTLASFFRDVKSCLAEHAVVTDVGSTKQWLDGEIRSVLRETGRVYIGSHPMTGTEKSGPSAARADLYCDAPVFLTPAETDDPRIVARLRQFWRAAGARVYCVTPAEHDRRVARTSHLPHLVAAALVAAAFRDQPVGMNPFIGPGFRDTTRIAGGSPDMWHDIVCTNREALLLEMEAFREVMDEMYRCIETREFERVRDFLDRVRHQRNGEMMS